MSSSTPQSELITRHAPLLESGLQALRTRESFSAFEGRKPAGPTREDADQQFDALLGSDLRIERHPGELAPQTDELSPYTGEALRISYPRGDVSTLVAASASAHEAWSTTSHAERVAVCLEMIERLFEANELLAIAAMHTTGQGRGMSQSGSGTNALDRGLEAVCAAHAALERVPTSSTWTRDFGTTAVSLDKTFSMIPLGPAVVVACASFPAWNVYPAVFANLATGNPVIIKPHPSSVLQMALAVQIMRSTLAAAGHDRNLVLLATDTADAPVAKELLTHDDVRIVDFTGSAVFGEWVEQNVRQAVVYTETSGVNSVVIESLDDVDAMITSLAGTLVLFSGQMCVAPQNIYAPAGGIPTPDGTMPFAELGERLVAAISAIAGHPKRAAALMGTVQSARTVAAVQELTEVVRERGRVLLEPASFEHPQYPEARTFGPLVAELSLADHDLYGHEQFGPVALLIPVEDADAGLVQATTDARNEGAISGFVLSGDEDFIARAERAYALAGAALSINIPGPMPMGFSVAFSDYHVSGLNPAGTATLTDEAFIAGRFRVVQSRRPAANPSAPAASEKRN